MSKRTASVPAADPDEARRRLEARQAEIATSRQREDEEIAELERAVTEAALEQRRQATRAEILGYAERFQRQAEAIDAELVPIKRELADARQQAEEVRSHIGLLRDRIQAANSRADDQTRAGDVDGAVAAEGERLAAASAVARLEPEADALDARCVALEAEIHRREDASGQLWDKVEHYRASARNPLGEDDIPPAGAEAREEAASARERALARQMRPTVQAQPWLAGRLGR